MTQLERLSASDAAQGIRDGLFDAEQLVQACLERIRQTEGQVQAWQHLDEAHALAQARARDADRREGRAIGPLHGVPVGIKDIIDTADMPTEDGTVSGECELASVAGLTQAGVSDHRCRGVTFRGAVSYEPDACASTFSLLSLQPTIMRERSSRASQNLQRGSAFRKPR